MTKLDVIEKIKQIIKDNNLSEQFFLIDKEILDTFYEVLNYGQSYINFTYSDISSKDKMALYNILRGSRDLTTSIYYGKKNEIDNGIYYINNIIKQLHPSYNIDISDLRNNLNDEYIDYSCHTNTLLKYLCDEFIYDYLKKLNLKLKCIKQEKTNQLSMEIVFKNIDTLKELFLYIDINGNVKIQIDGKEKNFKFKVKKHPLIEFDRNIEILFNEKINITNFQNVIDKINDKVYLYEKKYVVSCEAVYARHALEDYQKYGFDIIENHD